MNDFDFEALSNSMHEYRWKQEHNAKWRRSHRVLIAYQKESREFAKESAEKLTNEQAQYFFDRLKVRYKFYQRLVFHHMRRHGGNCGSCEIKLSPPTNVLALGHEVAHAVHMRKKHAGEHWHNKRFYGIMRRIIKVINTNKTAWSAALLAAAQRRAESEQNKQQKAVAMQAEKGKPNFKLAQIRARLKVWRTKEKRVRTAIKKLERREKIWEKKVVS